jgi:Ran GTPase-activating protein (RanGAP) involved in mRNA processing and transport
MSPPKMSVLIDSGPFFSRPALVTLSAFHALDWVPKRVPGSFSLCCSDFFCLTSRTAGAEVARCLLRSSHTLLDLSGNFIRDAGAEALAAAIRCNPNLTAIVLRSNDIGPSGASALIGALSRSKTITSLDLSGLNGVNRNHIGQKGCRALADALRFNPVLVSLNIDENGIGPYGLEQMLPGARRVVRLSALGYSLKEPGLENNTALDVLSLASNNLVRLWSRAQTKLDANASWSRALVDATNCQRL